VTKVPPLGRARPSVGRRAAANKDRRLLVGPRPAPVLKWPAMFGRAGRVAIVGSGAIAVAACSASPLPGTPLGTFTVTAHVVTNTCDQPATDRTYDVALSETSQSVLYWSFEDGSPILSSPVSTQLEAVLTSSVIANADPTEAGADGPCTMELDDRIDITLNSATAPTEFAGTRTYSFSATAGSNCSDQLISAGGTYQTLPCTVSFTLTALRQ
jgi:hypothetical protein